MDIEKIIEELRTIQAQLQTIVDEASMDADTCFHHQPDYIITWDHIQKLNQVIGRE